MTQAGDGLRRGVIERFFHEAQNRLSLTIRAQRVTRDLTEFRGLGGRIAERTESFSLDQLVRSLIQSGVPVTCVFDIATTVVAELEAQGWINTTIDRSDLVKVVNGALKGWPDEDAKDWLHDYNNRYGWEYEFAAEHPEQATADFVRISDIDALVKVAREALTAKDFSGTDGSPEAQRIMDDAHDRDVQRVVSLTSRSVSSTGLHTVSRDLVETVAQEIANWTLSPPTWTPEHRLRLLERVSALLTDAKKALTVENFPEAEQLVQSGLRRTTYILAQRFGLWIGLLDVTTATVIGRLANRVRVVVHMRIAAATKRGQVHHSFYGGSILDRLDEIGLTVEEFLHFLQTLIDNIRPAAAGKANTDADQGRHLKQVLDRAEVYRNWVIQLVSDTGRPPVLERDYFAHHDLRDREDGLDRILTFLVRGAKLDLIEQRGHALVVRLPHGWPQLTRFGAVNRLALVPVALGRRSELDVDVLHRRLNTVDAGVKVVVCPNGYSQAARNWILERESPGDLVMLVAADALRNFLSMPADMLRMLEEAANEIEVSRPSPPGLDPEIEQALVRARHFAADFHHEEALHGLSVQFERLLSSAIHGWLLALYGRDWQEVVRRLTGRRSVRLDLGTCVALLKLSDFTRERRKWLEARGVADAAARASAPERWQQHLFPLMIPIRNRSAHGAKRFYADEYKQFRDLFVQFLRTVVLAQARDGHRQDQD
jgi:nucleotide-binding universal stress UspA family protein